MPTYFKSGRFLRDFSRLTPAERQAVHAAVRKFRDDLPTRRFRKGLRVKRVQGSGDIFEMTWAQHGRATFQFGAEVVEGEPHVIWRRVGTHAVLSNP